VLIGARLLGGLSAGVAYPTTLALITGPWSGAARTRSIAPWSALGGANSSLAPLTAGALLEAFWWGSVFISARPLAVVAVAFVGRQRRGAVPRYRLDIATQRTSWVAARAGSWSSAGPGVRRGIRPRAQPEPASPRDGMTTMSDDVALGLTSLFVVTMVAALAPLVAGLLARARVPQVVVLILGGVLIGPQVLDWAEPESIELLSNVGLGFLFLLAGYELELRLFRERPGRLALLGWFVTAVVACAVVGLLAAGGLVRAFVPVALGLTTTALGTLLPILRDNDMLAGRFGRYMLATGAVGEFLPVVAIAIFLGANGRFLGLISLLAVGALAVVLTLAPRVARGRIGQIMREGEHATAQTTLRWTVVLLLLLLVVAEDFGLDVVLGAFLAGVVLRRWAPGDVEALEHKLDAVGYGFFIPVFFVSSGMGLNLRSILESPGRLVLFFILMLAVRGLPTLLIYRTVLPLRQRVELTLLAATALPLLVALSEIGLENGSMLPENAAALVGAGVLSVLVFPATAVAIRRRAG
jgi:Kef-type K+ transport system membrane component KefB